MTELAPGIWTTRRDSDPAIISHPSSRALYVCCALICVALVFAGRELAGANRYSMVEASPGIVARVDHCKGTIVFVAMTGREVSQYPSEQKP